MIAWPAFQCEKRKPFGLCRKSSSPLNFQKSTLKCNSKIVLQCSNLPRNTFLDMLVTTMIAQQNTSTATFEILEEKLFLLTICYLKFCNSKNTSGYITLYTLKNSRQYFSKLQMQHRLLQMTQQKFFPKAKSTSGLTLMYMYYESKQYLVRWCIIQCF